jgi:hypothetical protein
VQVAAERGAGPKVAGTQGVGLAAAGDFIQRMLAQQAASRAAEAEVNGDG